MLKLKLEGQRKNSSRLQMGHWTIALSHTDASGSLFCQQGIVHNLWYCLLQSKRLHFCQQMQGPKLCFPLWRCAGAHLLRVGTCLHSLGITGSVACMSIENYFSKLITSFMELHRCCFFQHSEVWRRSSLTIASVNKSHTDWLPFLCKPGCIKVTILTLSFPICTVSAGIDLQSVWGSVWS